MPGNLALAVGKRPPLLTSWINVEMCALTTVAGGPESVIQESQVEAMTPFMSWLWKSHSLLSQRLLSHGYRSVNSTKAGMAGEAGLPGSCLSVLSQLTGCLSQAQGARLYFDLRFCPYLAREGTTWGHAGAKLLP